MKIEFTDQQVTDLVRVLAQAHLTEYTNTSGTNEQCDLFMDLMAAIAKACAKEGKDFIFNEALNIK